MRIFAPTETDPSERRVPLVPASVTKLAALGAQVEVEAGLGRTVYFSDAEYEAAGAKIVADLPQALASADIVLRLRKPPIAAIAALKRGCIHISFLDPFTDVETVRALAAAGASAICMEMIPRSTIAQKMDALSSQASLAGYVAVLLGENRLDSIFPMMMTPAGTITSGRTKIEALHLVGVQGRAILI